MGMKNILKDVLLKLTLSKFLGSGEKDVKRLVIKFQDPSLMLIRCNPSFIDPITKVQDPMYIINYRNITLNGYQYETIGKLG